MRPLSVERIRDEILVPTNPELKIEQHLTKTHTRVALVSSDPCATQAGSRITYPLGNTPGRYIVKKKPELRHPIPTQVLLNLYLFLMLC